MPAHDDALRKARDPQGRRSWFALALYERTPMQKGLLTLFNRCEEAIRQNDALSQSELREEIEQNFTDIERAKGDGHSNPAWLLETLRGNIARLFDQDQKYLDRAGRSLELARAEWQKAVSSHNIAGALLRLGRPAEAIEYQIRAVDLDPYNEGFWAQLVEAYFRDGRLEDAEDILSNVQSSFGLEKGSAWAMCLKHDSTFLEMAAKSRICRDLVQRARAL
jgi:tetratricopeptide (TPR) repeat protein